MPFALYHTIIISRKYYPIVPTFSLIEQKEKLENAYSKQEEIEKKVMQFIKNFLKCFNKIIKDANDEEIVKLMRGAL